ncbi:hypothetical protein DYB38_014019 [Aphanomyces astaci]|uniref:Uncharacterized protein n=1 Tax=Aphanomyces astaci TaxID=112090 RepID=A0A397CE01_APHAT|nr:hypothetical protein DYB38_014019 [Aphanomyces astaci]
MGLLSSSVQPFVGTPFDELRPLAYTVWKTDSLTQAMSRDLSEFYSTPDHVPQRNRIDALNISKTYLELDQVEHSELYVVNPTLSETDRERLFERIKTRFKSNPMDNTPAVIANYLRTLMFTGESCIDILSVELIDLVKRYRRLLGVTTALPLPSKHEPNFQLSRIPLRPVRLDPKRLRKPMARYMF